MVVAVVALGIAAAGLAAGLIVVLRKHRGLRAAVVSAVGRIGSDGEVHSAEPAEALDRAISKIEQTMGEIEVRTLRYHGAIHGADLGIVVLDAERAHVFSNPAAEKYLETTHGHAVADLRLREIVDRVIRSHLPEMLEFDLFVPQRKVLRLQALPLVKHDGVLGVVVYVDELTERRRIDVMRKDFVANVSHELKTPLGALSILAETLAEADDEEVRRRLAARLGDEASRMAHLVDDILSLSHLESEGSDKAPLRLESVFADAERQVAVTARELGIVVMAKPPDEHVMVAGDHDQLVSALVNLLDNAIKYTHVKVAGAGGAVWCRAVEDGDAVVIEVEDQGIGIPEQHRTRIFERFYRADRARSRESGGTGLGLSIVRHIVLNHGGEVGVESKAGVGSTFWIRLPLWRE